MKTKTPVLKPAFDRKDAKDVFAEMKKQLSKNDDERLEQLGKIFKDTKATILKIEGKCDDDELVASLCKNLGLEYLDFLALSTWVIIN